MTDHILGDRKNGLENAFFAEQDAVLRRHLRELDEIKRRKESLSEVSGIKDDAVLDMLLHHNMSSETLVALSLVPSVVIAWADGSLDVKERGAILENAEQAGVDKHHAGYQLLEGWLAKMPPPKLISTWKAYISAISATLSDEARHAFKAEIIGRARSIAIAAGGFMNMGQKVSASEAAILRELEQAFLPHR